MFGISLTALPPPVQQHRIRLLEATPMPTDATQALCELLGRGRDVREEAANILRAVEAVLECGKLADQTARSREVRRRFQRASAIWAHDSGLVISVLFMRMRCLLDAHPVVYDGTGDQVTRVENAWEGAAVEWTDLPSLDDATHDDAMLVTRAEDILAGLAKIKPLLVELRNEAAFLTVPQRALDQLRSTRVGEALDFHATFEDEVPDRDQRLRILKYLARHPDPVDGFIDVEGGVIVRFERALRKRMVSYLRIGALVLVGALFAYFAPDAKPWIAGWPFEPKHRSALLVTYIAIFVGALVHIVVDAVKEVREKPKASFTAIGSWGLWVNARETSILGGIVTVMIAFVGTVFTAVSASKDGQLVDWTAAVGIGYGVDSIAGIYLNRFQTVVSKLTEAAEAKAKGATG